MSSRRIRTVRCILTTGDRHLLAVHRGARRWGRGGGRWGLVGGHLDTGEAPQVGACREVLEELGLELDSSALRLVDDFHYKGAWHRVFAAAWHDGVSWFDRGELLKIGWHSLEDVARLERQRALHAGFEREAVQGVLALPPWPQRVSAP